MRHFFLFLIAFCSVTATSFAQEFTIKGIVIDQDTKEPLEGATVYAETIKDSTLVSYTITNVDGRFELEGKTALKELNLFFSFNGYAPKKQLFPVKKLTELPTVLLAEQVEELKGVQVMGERVPITIKKDTLEFNAQSFKTRPDATVEDVLKKLPGVEVDSDGKITVDGKEVNQVLVNGQVFFSNDPKVATKSLPKEIISKIQITNTKTKKQEASGDEGDGENKTINLTIREDKNKGYLGRLAAGYGTDERYQLSGLLNYFDNKERVSVLASSNNINSSGFSFDEIFDMLGNSGGGRSFNSNGGFSVGGVNFGFGQGITTSSTLGASYANQKKNVYEASGNYFYANSDSFNDQKTSRENILPDNSRFFTNNESNFTGGTESHRAGAELEFDLSPTLEISIEPSVSFNKTNSRNSSNTISTDEDENVINQNETLSFDDGTQRNFSNELAIFKKLDTIGGYLEFSFRNNNQRTDSDGSLASQRLTFGANPTSQVLDQQTAIENKSDTYEFDASYRIALKNKFLLDLGYNYNSNSRKNQREVFDLDAATNQYTLFNTQLSSDFEFKNNQQTPSIGIRRNSDKFRFGVTASFAQANLTNDDFLQNSSFDKTYEQFLFNVFSNYTIGRNQRLSLRYNSDLNVPSVTQLQPIPNVNNPLNVVTGNPNLSPSIAHRLNVNFSNYNWRERSGFYVYAGVTFNQDQVSSVTLTDADFIRTTTFTNVDGNSNGYAGMGYSKQIKKDSVYTLKLNFRPNFNFNNEVGFTNGVELKTFRTDFSPRISTTYNYKELFEIEPEYGITFSNTKYSLDALEDISFLSHNVSLKTTTYWPENIIWGNDINYNYNGNVGPGFRKDALFWNMSIGVQAFKKSTTFKVLAYDLLNQNFNTRRSAGQDFIQDFQGTVLQQYFMFSATFKFDQFGGKKPQGNGRRYYRG